MTNPNQTNTELETLVNNYLESQTTLTEYTAIYAYPICGKPGFGFKAARKAKSVIRDMTKMRDYDLTRLREWARGTSKMNVARRTARLERVQALIPTFTLD